MISEESSSSTGQSSCAPFVARIKHLRTQYGLFFKKVCGSMAPYESLTAWILFHSCQPHWCVSKNFRIDQLPILGKSPLHRYLKYAMCRAVDISEAAYSIECFLVNVWNESETHSFSRDADSPNSMIELRDMFEVNDTLLFRLRERYHDLNFEADLLRMCANYDAVFGFSRGQGRGWQLSIPRPFHALLVTEFDVCCEAFASPVNAQSSAYFSLFPEDICFGSLGNFFAHNSEFFQQSKAVEVNPPFEPLVMEQTVLLLQKLLNRSVEEHTNLLFIVILPNWEKCFPIDFVKKSSFLQKVIPLAKGTHEYMNGWPYHAPLTGPRPVWNDSDSLVAFLSTSPVIISDDLTQTLIDSWHC